jgi:PilZ domain
VADEAKPKPEHNHRLARRRAITRKIGIEYRKGVMGLGPDLAIVLLDVSEDGLGVRLKLAVTPGDEAEIVLTSPGTRKAYKLLGEVRWCRDAGDGTFLAGVQLRRRLAYADLSDLTR